MIELRQVTLRFDPRRSRSLRERISSWARPRRTPVAVEGSVTALHDINVRIERGERVGVIGFNGAGKTTLLKVMCGIYTPTSGSVRVDGDVACLFETTIGFEMESTGWQNIWTRGLLLGLTRREIRERMRDIAEFTELGPALDRPVKTYSNGMFVRLAFAVSTCISPDVLLLDEVIAAGDIRFHERAKRRLEQMVEKASLVVLVSHSMDSVREMCGRVLWLKDGAVFMDGPTEEVVSAYVGSAPAPAA